ncbi:MAG TPA: 3'(2'),5'-bisphosphate nucleotidase CysQ [Taishania sp.]|nr:3'(2'),5'-bisphosphate nucleotidase CysQ [Taishania sp.]HNS41196.1 3'(2'),5'-bisphosphate nucleotidase CysQ [Taishania sp.]
MNFILTFGLLIEMKELNNHYTIALKASVLAADEIMRVYHTSFQKELKSDGSPVTEADKRASAIITKELKQTEIPIISEEELKENFEIRQSWKTVWIVDPLDGTKEFIKQNDEFAVNIALVENGNPVFGLIASPVEQTILFGGKEIGCFIAPFNAIDSPNNWTKLTAKELNNPVVLTSSRTPNFELFSPLIEEIKSKKDIDFIKKGSALKFFDLAQGWADVYPRFAPTMEWDIAAGQAILEALGGKVLDVNTGKPLTYNKESLYNPHFIAKTKAFINCFGE